MELKELIKNIGRALIKRKIEYMIIGGQAVLIYGEPRLTRDIDITLGLNIDGYKQIEEVIKELNLKILSENPVDFLEKTMVLPAMDEESGMRVDFIFSFSDYEKQALKRVNKINFDGIEICYASVEDLIIHKIISGRERDLEDAKIIVVKNKKIDEDYILKWLYEFEKVLNEKLVERFNKIKDAAR